ncbi:hypothetical protein HGRIS_006732 [Hohenbuehelia grisea]|uniref:Uncharacterized protein n=1 Tax=Hohenbuehelia grisea TaxID=104357 RepID=A0ABR3J9Y9_9AGAR
MEVGEARRRRFNLQRGRHTFIPHQGSTASLHNAPLLTCSSAHSPQGYIKSTVHRVRRPPPDQESLGRLAIGYFSRPGDDLPLVPAPSPVLRREGYLTEEDERADPSEAVKGAEYVRARVKDVNDRKRSRIGERGEEAMFRVKNLAVRDYYL